MNKLKKLLALALVVCMVCAVNTTAWANPSEIEPYVNTACPQGNGIHQMRSRSIGWVYAQSTNEFLINGRCCWQCDNCYTVIITSDDPVNGDKVGYYVTAAFDEPTNINGTTIDVWDSSDLDYCGTKNLEGHRFFYSRPYALRSIFVA